MFCSFHPLVGWTRTGGSALPNKGILLSSLVASQWRAGEGGGAFSFAAGAGAGWRTPLLAPLPRGTERVATIDRFPPAFSAPPPPLPPLPVCRGGREARDGNPCSAVPIMGPLSGSPCPVLSFPATTATRTRTATSATSAATLRFENSCRFVYYDALTLPLPFS